MKAHGWWLGTLLATHLTASAGDHVWQWATPAGGVRDDAALRIAAGPEGGVYVAGTYGGTAKFGGTQLDSIGGGTDATRWFLARLDRAGNFVQTVRLDFPDSLDFPNQGSVLGLASDADGSVRVTRQWGVRTNFAGADTPHWTVSKLGASGQVIWTTENAPGENGRALASVGDAVGNTYLYGPTWFQKLAPDGQASPVVAVAPQPALTTRAIAVDPAGSLYVAGRVGRSIRIVKYGSAGATAWERSFGGGDPNDRAADVYAFVLDPQGNPVITGLGDIAAAYGHYVAKLDATDGHLLWASQTVGAAGNSGNALGVDAQGRIYNAGTFYGTASFGSITRTAAGYSDAFVSRLSPSGEVEWVETAGGSLSPIAYPDRQDIPYALSVSPVGDVILAGTFAEASSYGPYPAQSQGGRDVVVARLGVSPLARVTPDTQTRILGQTAGFTANVTGAGTFSYQWLKEGGPIPGATAANFTIPKVVPGDSGAYSVTVTGPFGTTTSLPASLAVSSSGIAIGSYAGITVVGEVGHRYEILYKDRVEQADWVVGTTITLTSPSQIWFDLESAALPLRIYSFRPAP